MPRKIDWQELYLERSLKLLTGNLADRFHIAWRKRDRRPLTPRPVNENCGVASQACTVKLNWDGWAGDIILQEGFRIEGAVLLAGVEPNSNRSARFRAVSRFFLVRAWHWSWRQMRSLKYEEAIYAI